MENRIVKSVNEKLLKALIPLIRKTKTIIYKRQSPELKLLQIRTVIRRVEKKLNHDIAIILKDNLFIEKKQYTRPNCQVIVLKNLPNQTIFLN